MNNNLIPSNLLISGAINILRNSNIYYQSYIYNYIISVLDKKLKQLGNGSSYPRITPEVLGEIRIPFPDDITKFEPILNKLMLCHKTKSELEFSLPNKEKFICDLIKKLSDEGKEGVDYDEYKLGDICEFKAAPGGKSLQQYYTTENKKYGFITGKNLNGSSEMTYINDIGYKLCKQYTVVKNDILIPEVYNNTSKSLLVNDKWDGYVFKGAFRLRNLKINKQYLLYYINSDNFKNQAIKMSRGTIFLHISIEILHKIFIKVLKPEIMKKHKLQELFDEVDKIREDIEINKNKYESLSNEFMLMIEPNYKKDESADNSSSDELINNNNKEGETTKIKVKKIVKKKMILDDNI